MTRNRLILGLSAALLLAAVYWLWTGDLFTPKISVYADTFEEAGEWDSGDDANALAEVRDGRYEITVRANVGIYRGSAPQQFADGIYEVTATQLEGPLDNGYGLVIKLDPDANRFYMFEVSGDGFAWSGLCDDGCDNQGWVEAPAVNQGRDNPNRLRVEVNGPDMVFFVNDQEVSRFNDDQLSSGQVGFLVETFGGGGVKVAFDDFSVRPLSE